LEKGERSGFMANLDGCAFMEKRKANFTWA
jgi:hypothetical protein